MSTYFAVHRNLQIVITFFLVIFTDLSYASSGDIMKSEKAITIVKQQSQAFDQALIDMDAQAVGELYSVDTKIIPSLIGRDAVIGSAQRLIEAKESLRLSIINLWTDGSVIVHDAAVEFYNIETGEITGKGQALLVWRNEDGHWRIFRDVYKPNKKTPD